MVESSNPGQPNLTKRCQRFATISTSTQVAVFALALSNGDGTTNSLNASAPYSEYNEDRTS